MTKIKKFASNLLGISGGSKPLRKIENQIEEEKINNHGLSDREQATVQFKAFETFTTTMAKGQLTALASVLTLTGTIAGGVLPRLFLVFRPTANKRLVS